MIDQRDVVDNGSQSGVGDVLQSLFFSPKAPTAGGWTWGAGPGGPDWGVRFTFTLLYPE